MISAHIWNNNLNCVAVLPCNVQASAVLWKLAALIFS